MINRPWEVSGTREIPEWEREALAEIGPHLIRRTGSAPASFTPARFADEAGQDEEESNGPGADR